MPDKDTVMLDILKEYYQNLVDQFVIQTDATEYEAKIKIGLMMLYHWGYANKNENVINGVKQEAENLLERTGDFFDKAVTDFESIKSTTPRLAKAYAELSPDGYDQFVSFVQKAMPHR